MTGGGGPEISHFLVIHYQRMFLHYRPAELSVSWLSLPPLAPLLASCLADGPHASHCLYINFAPLSSSVMETEWTSRNYEQIKLISNILDGTFHSSKIDLSSTNPRYLMDLSSQIFPISFLENKLLKHARNEKKFMMHCQVYFFYNIFL